jgi:hypothetical protein
MLKLIKTSIGTKFVVRWSTLMCQLALQAVRTVAQEADAGAGPVSDNVRAVDVKRYARVEKIPGGEIEDSAVLAGVMLNKDIVHPKMRRRIARPRIVLLDCPLEYKKGESQTNIEMSKEDDYAKISMLEEEQVKSMVDRILEFKPDLVITEKGISGNSLLLDAKQTALMSSTKTTPSIGCTRRTSPRFAASASRTTTESRARPARRLSTALRTSARRTSARAVGSSTSRRSAMSACQTPPRCPPWHALTPGASPQVLHVLDGVRDTQGVHYPPPRAVQGHPQRGRAQPAGRDGRRAQRVFQPRACARRRRDRDGHVRSPRVSRRGALTDTPARPARSACTPKRAVSLASRAGRTAPSRTRWRSSRARSCRTLVGMRSAFSLSFAFVRFPASCNLGGKR